MKTEARKERRPTAKERTVDPHYELAYKDNPLFAMIPKVRW